MGVGTERVRWANNASSRFGGRGEGKGVRFPTSHAQSLEGDRPVRDSSDLPSPANQVQLFH